MLCTDVTLFGGGHVFVYAQEEVFFFFMPIDSTTCFFVQKRSFLQITIKIWFNNCTKYSRYAMSHASLFFLVYLPKRLCCVTLSLYFPIPICWNHCDTSSAFQLPQWSLKKKKKTTHARNKHWITAFCIGGRIYAQELGGSTKMSNKKELIGMKWILLYFFLFIGLIFNWLFFFVLGLDWIHFSWLFFLDWLGFTLFQVLFLAVG